MGIVSRLRHTAVIRRASEGARNEYGVKTPTWADLRTVRCWLQPVSRTEATEQGGAGTLRVDAKVFMLPTDITEKDRLVIRGDEYQVVEVQNPAGKDQHFEVGVLRTGQGGTGTP